MMRFGQGGKKDEADDALAQRQCVALGSRSVVLVGMPGCGKSAVGRRLIERDPIASVLVSSEPSLREGERRVIARLLASGPQVLATGGGAFMVAETRENIRRSGISVWLKAELPLLMRRVLKKNNRPLLMNDPEASMKRLMTARYPIYATADITVETREVPHEVIVGEIIQALCARLGVTAAADVALNPGEAT